MSQKLNEHLIKIITNTLIFFEFGDENILDPDYAMQAIEDIASELRMLDDVDKVEVVKIFHNLSNLYNGEYKNFVQTLPNTLGIYE